METISIHIASDQLILILMFLCLCIVAFFSGSEAALMTASKMKIKHRAEKGNKAAKTVLRITEHYDKLFGTILATENLFIIFATSLGTALAVKRFGPTGIAWATLGMTLFIVILGEITPKTFAASKAEKIALLVARPIEFIIKITTPIIFILISISKFFVWLLGGEPKLKPYYLTEDEIKTAIDLVSREGSLPAGKRDMLHGVFTFADTAAYEIMTPRVEVICIEAESSIEHAIDIIKNTGHSRMPVYEKNLDNITGILYAKDLLGYAPEKNLKIKDIKRPCIFVPGSQKLIKLLSDLKEKKSTMAIIIDEFGGTAGLVTIERILEEIVGDIEDEYDTEEKSLKETAPGTFLVSAKVDIYQLNNKLSLNIPEGNYITLGGFIVDLLGRIPNKEEEILFKKIKFKISSTKKHKIDLVEIKLKENIF